MKNTVVSSLFLLAGSSAWAADGNFFQLTLGEYSYTSTEREQGGNAADIEETTSHLGQPIKFLFNFAVTEQINLRPAFEVEQEGNTLDINSKLTGTYRVLDDLELGAYLEIDRNNTEQEQGNNKVERSDNTLIIGPTARYTMPLAQGTVEMNATAFLASGSEETQPEGGQAQETETSGVGMTFGADFNYPVGENLEVTAGAEWGYMSLEAETKVQNNAQTNDASAWRLSLRPIGVRMLF